MIEYWLNGPRHCTGQTQAGLAQIHGQLVVAVVPNGVFKVGRVEDQSQGVPLSQAVDGWLELKANRQPVASRNRLDIQQTVTVLQVEDALGDDPTGRLDKGQLPHLLTVEVAAIVHGLGPQHPRCVRVAFGFSLVQ